MYYNIMLFFWQLTIINNSISTKITVFITVALKKALPKIVGMPYFIGFSTLFICLMFSSWGRNGTSFTCCSIICQVLLICCLKPIFRLSYLLNVHPRSSIICRNWCKWCKSNAHENEQFIILHSPYYTHFWSTSQDLQIQTSLTPSSHRYKY